MMPSAPSASGSLLVLQAGGPTTVVNTTLAAIIESAVARRRFTEVVGVRRGVEGLIVDDTVSLNGLPADRIAALRAQPGAALGSSRRPLREEDLDRVAATLAAHRGAALLMIGGNGTMRAACQLNEGLRSRGSEACVIGVPKTVDNDIPGTDRCPGYASAARFVAQSIRDVIEDVRTLPVPVTIFETMGRDTGWLAAATVLARSTGCPGPQIILLPEHPFAWDVFLRRIDEAVTRDGWAVAAVSEGICDRDGCPVHETDITAHRDEVGRPVPGDVGPRLAREVGEQLGLRCRSEKPGLCGRTAMSLVAPQDRLDAEAVGRAAVQAAEAAEGGVMIALHPLEEGGTPRTGTVPLARLDEARRGLPPSWIDANGEPTQDFVDYLCPRMGIPVRGHEML